MECCVCWATYSVAVKPFVGKCGHSICGGCVPKLRDASCPTCRVDEAFDSPSENYLAKELLQHIEAAGGGQNPAATGSSSRVRTPVVPEGDDAQDLHEAMAMVISENASLQRLIEEFSNQAALRDDVNNMLHEQVINLTESLNNQEMANKELKEERDLAQALLASQRHTDDDSIRRTTEVQEEWDSSSSEEEEEEDTGDDVDDEEEDEDDEEEDEDDEEEEDSSDEDSDNSDDNSDSSLAQLTPHIQRRNVEDCSFM